MWNHAPQSTWVALPFHYKLKCLKFRLKHWNKTTFGNLSQIKQELLAKIEEIDRKEAEEGLLDQDRNCRSRLKEEFMEITARAFGDRKLG